MSIFLDTGYFFALANKTELTHQKAADMSISIKKGLFGDIFTSSYIFDELMTLTMSRQNHENALKLGQSIIDSEIIILDISHKIFDESWGLFRQRKNLSFTDCTTVKTMLENKIQNLATFDRHFSQFRELNLLF
ncbi:MAG: PIN domain-containing protein [Patescibacteria group bacterium]